MLFVDKGIISRGNLDMVFDYIMDNIRGVLIGVGILMFVVAVLRMDSPQPTAQGYVGERYSNHAEHTSNLIDLCLNHWETMEVEEYLKLCGE